MALVLLSMILNAFAIFVAFVTLLAIASLFRLLPLNAEATVSEALLEMSRYMVAPIGALTFIGPSNPIKIDSTNWYGRGNVLYQIGRILERTDLIRQRARGDDALAYLSKV